MKITKNITTIALATGFAIAAPLANGATILNSTNFDGTEPTSDGNATGFEDGPTGFDTINGWTWATDWFAPGGGGSSTGDYTGTLFASLATVNTVPNRPFEDQQIRVGSGLELLPSGQFSFKWGHETNSDVALAQAFSLSSLLAVTVTYDVTSTNAGTYIYVDDGSGAWTTRAHTVVAGTGNTYTFTPTSNDIRIAFVGNDGDDGTSGASLGSDTLFDSIQVSQVPEPSSALLIGLGGLALTLRRRR